MNKKYLNFKLDIVLYNELTYLNLFKNTILMQNVGNFININI